METITITKHEFDELPEYSCTVPGGTAIGVRWKRNENASCRSVERLDFFSGDPVYASDEWWMGEYAHHQANQKLVRIIWRKIVVVDQ